MIIPQRLGAVNNIYYTSIDASELQKGIDELESILAITWLDTDIREDAESMLWRVKSKKLALEYLLGGYLDSDYQALKEFVGSVLPQAEEKGYVGTANILSELKDKMEKVYEIMFDAYAQSRRILSMQEDSDEFSLLTTSGAECFEVAEIFRKKLQMAENLGTKNIFPEQVKFVSVRGLIIDDLQEIVDFATKSAENLREQNIQKAIGTATQDFVDEYRNMEYYLIPSDSRNLANCLVVCTPFDDEAECYIAKRFSQNMKILKVGAFGGMTAQSIAEVFDYFAKTDTGVVLKGLNKYFGENKNDIYYAAIRFAKTNKNVVIVDNSGSRTLYDEAMEVVNSHDDITVMDISFEYLQVPLYDDILQLFEEKSMLSEVSASDIRERLPFLGYVGLNKIAKAYASGKSNWMQIGAEHSDYNKSFVEDFLQELPNQSLLIDKKWGDFAKGLVEEKRLEFDYDSIKYANPQNIRKILQGNFTIYQKCGMIVRYCTLYGEDKSVWAGLDCEEKSKRLTEATKLVMSILETGKDPIVEVVEQFEGEHKLAGGLCSQGGKLIQYKRSCVDDYDWTIDTICHECFHGFQNTAIYGAWHNWYWKELGVTQGRIEEWRVNQENYFNISRGMVYTVQVFECEARAFAKDCLRESNKVWHLIDFE